MKKEGQPQISQIVQIEEKQKEKICAICESGDLIDISWQNEF